MLTIRYDTTRYDTIFFFLLSPLSGNPHIFTSRIDVFLVGWFVGFVCTGYDRRFDDLLFHVGFLYL